MSAVRSQERSLMEERAEGVEAAERLEFLSVARPLLSEEVAERLQRAILSGTFKLGDRLPSELELAHWFGVSRVVVREALRTLENLGLVAIKGGRTGGIFVASSDVHLFQRALLLNLRLQGLSVEELIEARLIYEPEVARLAAVRATADDLALLERILEQQREEVEHGYFVHPTNLSFHRAMAQATRNPLLEMVIQVVLELIRDRVARWKLPEGSWQRILARHERLYEALRGRDPEEACRVMREHVLEVGEMLTRVGRRHGKGVL
jgi:DNA-binding FadR family transcriptional regulator